MGRFEKLGASLINLDEDETRTLLLVLDNVEES